MKYTDQEYLQALEDLKDRIDELQSSEQIEYNGLLDKALSELDGRVLDEIEKRSGKEK